MIEPLMKICGLKTEAKQYGKSYLFDIENYLKILMNIFVKSNSSVIQNLKPVLFYYIKRQKGRID